MNLDNQIKDSATEGQPSLMKSLANYFAGEDVDTPPKAPQIVYQIAPASDVQVAAASWVTLALGSAMFGMTQKAMRRKIERSVWLEGRHFKKADGGIFISVKALEKWVETGR